MQDVTNQNEFKNISVTAIIKQVVEEFEHGNESAFCKKMGVGAAWVTQATNPTYKFFSRIWQLYGAEGLNPVFLLSGEGEVRLSKNRITVTEESYQQLFEAIESISIRLKILEAKAANS